MIRCYFFRKISSKSSEVWGDFGAKFLRFFLNNVNPCLQLLIETYVLSNSPLIDAGQREIHKNLCYLKNHKGCVHCLEFGSHEMKRAFLKTLGFLSMIQQMHLLYKKKEKSMLSNSQFLCIEVKMALKIKISEEKNGINSEQRLP